MNFERGRGVKESLELGLLPDLIKYTKDLLRDHIWDLSDDVRKTEKVIAQKIYDKMNLNVTIGAIRDLGGNWTISLRCLSITKEIIKIEIQEGLRYAEDYQAAYTSRSMIIDKAYIEGVILNSKTL